VRFSVISRGPARAYRRRLGKFIVELYVARGAEAALERAVAQEAARAAELPFERAATTVAEL
jgi:hypothetical protein